MNNKKAHEKHSTNTNKPLYVTVLEWLTSITKNVHMEEKSPLKQARLDYFLIYNTMQHSILLFDILTQRT